MFAEIQLTMAGRKAFRSPSKSGACCVFHPLTAEYGAKMYFDVETRDVCFSRQEFAAQHDLAPKVGQKFEFSRLRKNTVYNYETQKYDYLYEIVKVYGFITEIVLINGEIYTDHPSGYREYLNTYDNLQYLKDELTAIGMFPHDMHADNYGWTASGIVATDFSHFADDNEEDSDED